jgi:hypothetical protein
MRLSREWDGALAVASEMFSFFLPACSESGTRTGNFFTLVYCFRASMRIALLYDAAGIMILVPVSTGTVLALFPHEMLIPLWFWVVWFLVSVWAVWDAPVRVESLISADRVHQSTRYGKVGMFLALGNVVWSIAALIYLGWWSG